MKRLFSLFLITTSLLIGSNSAKANEDFWGIQKRDPDLNEIKDGDGFRIFEIDSTTGEGAFVTSLCDERINPYGKYECNFGEVIINESNGFIEIEDKNNGGSDGYQTAATGSYHIFNPETKTWSLETRWRTNYTQILQKPVIITDTNGNIKLEVAGKKLIEQKTNGEVHIGENSLVTRERNSRQELYATDANGNKIPIDVTNGSKLLINGRDVEQSINNVGALSAALTGLPTVPTDTTLACGLGTGTHGGDFAFSGGCASKVNEKLSINYAASMTMPGQDYAGKFEDKFSARAGFVWQLGKSNKPTQISMKAKEEMKEKIYSLEEKNEKILSKNKKLENKVSSLIARLERLEKVALGESRSKDLATIKLP